MAKKIKILFPVTHRPNRSPSPRFRIEQFIPFLEQNGFECDFTYFVTEKLDHYLYKRGHYLHKFFILIRAIVIRLKDLWHLRKYDIVFVQREAFPTGSVFFERRFARSKAKLVYDFDDAIWLDAVSDSNKKLKWLKRPDKTQELIAMSDLVLAGNNYLADFAKRLSKNVMVIPTVVDIEHYKNSALRSTTNRPICIGWSGSITTIEHFKLCLPALKKIKMKFGDSVCFKVVGNKDFVDTDLGIQGIDWGYNSEIENLEEIDIGLMPLPADEWSKGKCGGKGIVYMAMGIPAVMSAVGVNSEIITDGVNGFLVHNDDEWFEKLERLIKDPMLRSRLGIAGRETVVKRYSVESVKEQLLSSLKLVAKSEREK